MEWHFRKSFSPIPGVRLTLSPSGITTSVEVGPIRIIGSRNGNAFSASIPGTGLSFRQPLGSGHAPAPQHTPSFTAPVAENQVPVPMPPPASSSIGSLLPPMQHIRSAGSSALTSTGLAAFKETLETAQQQFAAVEHDLNDARKISTQNTSTYRRWADGWLLRRILKRRFAQIQAKAEESQAAQRELETQLELSRLRTQIEMPDGVAKAFSRFADDFTACTHSKRIWDNVAFRATNRIAERTVANRAVDLKPVKFGSRQCGIIQTPMSLPYLENANGGDIYVYPGFIVYHASATNYALIEFADVELKVERINFHEEKSVPDDAIQVGTTWAKTNKDGSPDRRFKDNYPIPVMQYAQLTLKSAAGLNEEYILSNVVAAEAVEQAWLALRDAVKQGI
ncbi:DUF4236 domain-containing protein [Burkholderia stagnalis]|uniref:DUF4236 domain-containing protein n=2 Tax=Burkholderia cepacia complex TaxID=87882 RepID=A0A6L3N5T3_9BURK|nr:DUF4236 domain-containing protein [Burkholderia stagnalis]KAB0641657.1 DUF4236 domain-containing protein [Burkholderia stagnalis]